MGMKESPKKLHLSRHRRSLKRIWRKRRAALKLQKEHQNDDTKDATNESINLQKEHQNDDTKDATNEFINLQKEHQNDDTKDATNESINLQKEHQNDDTKDATNESINLQKEHQNDDTKDATNESINLQKEHQNDDTKDATNESINLQKEHQNDDTKDATNESINLQKEHQNDDTKDAINESIDLQNSKESLPDIKGFNISTEVMQRLTQKTEDMHELNVKNCNVDTDDKLIIDNAFRTSFLYTNRIQENIPEGRRIVDISFMWSEIHRTFDSHARGIECQFKDWKLVRSRYSGLLTQLFFKCEMCKYEATVWSEPTASEILNTNTAVVAGTITIGIGYAQLEELCAAMNISCMSETTYIKYREDLVDDFERTALKNMRVAAEMEKQFALERNETINGIPYITVVTDGSWMKRSYGNSYNSLSGVGAIIGYRTRKVLFVGIRNKFCTVCDMAERKSVEPKVHKCYKNFDRSICSTSMERDTIVEGFKSSLEMYGLIYKTVVADGDSNMYQTIVTNNPYQEQNVVVKKIECTNHLLRNLCKKLKVVSKMTQPKKQRKPGFVQIRNIVKHKILKMRREVLKTAAVRNEESQPHHYKTTELEKDILNIPSHIFGEHKRCKERGRECADNPEIGKNYVPYLKLHGLYARIKDAFKSISAHSDSLLLNFTNNSVESFNSIVCKEIGGKRINFGKRGSYNARIAGAVVQYNTQEVLTQLHKKMCKTVPPIVEKLEKRRQIKVARNRNSRKVDNTFKTEENIL